MSNAENATETHHCKRPGCTGILRSEASVARGMSVLCDRKVRQAEAAANRPSAYTEDRRAKAAAAIRSGEITVEEPGLYSIPSATNDSRYASDGHSCVCPAGAMTHPRRCWHLLAATVADLLITSRPALITPPAAPAAPAWRDVWAEMDRITDALMAV